MEEKQNNNKPRKVFISFLGTNNYVQCHYVIDGLPSQPVRFVQEALVEYLCKDWTEEDRIFIFYTSKEKTGENGSKEINWFDNGHPKTYEEIEKIGLKHRLDDLTSSMSLKATIESFDIEAGFSEEEIWNIFDTVYSKLEPHDEIYFDVTHAFRSIPLFSIVLFNYSKFMKETSLKSIMYGAFEKLGPAFKVREMPLEKRLAPVIDLTNIARLQEYNQIASSLKDFGRVKMLKEVITETQETASNDAFIALGNSISELDQYIETIDLNAIKSGSFIKRFRDNYKRVRRNVGLLAKPIKNILDELNQETSDFVDISDFRNIEAAINWTIKHGMLMQAYALAEEYIILRAFDKFKKLQPEKLNNKQFRMFLSDILGAPEEDFSIKKWKGRVADYPAIADEIADETFIKRLRPYYEPIRSSRNSLAHGNGVIKYQRLVDDIPKIKTCIDYINTNNDSDSYTQEKLSDIQLSLFLNFSNHPVKDWTEEQLEAAEQYGEIQEMPFPSVNPNAGQEDIETLVNEYVDQFAERSLNSDLTVHVMGEMTFTYNLVARLKALGIRCVASTTERNTHIDNDGNKVSEFKFVQFREY